VNKLLVVIISTSILLTLSFPSAFATSYTIADTLTGGDCVALGGTWDNVLKICTVNNLTINSVDTLQINSGITFVIDGLLLLSGNLNNDGTIEIHILRILSGGVMSNLITGTINNNGNFDPDFVAYGENLN